jgi:hypothetical protein
MNESAEMKFQPLLLMEGGPLYNVQKRMGLIRRDASLIERRAFLAALITWLPLLLLSAMNGRAFGHSVPVSFIRDFGACSRFLFAVPLLLLAENILGPQIAATASHFIKSRVVIEKDYVQFDRLVGLALRARDSVIAEIVIAILAYAFSIVAFLETAVHVTTWYETRTATGATLTLAGLWLIGLCIPFFQFLVFRWVWRLFLWFQFLNRVRKLDLQLFPTHPDLAGGMGFVGGSQRFFGILLFAISVGSAGVLANDIIYDKVPLVNFAPAIALYAIASVIVLLGPLAVLTGTLAKVKHRGLREYGRLATTYTGSFQRKWIESKSCDLEQLLGTGDIQSLADLGNSYDYVDNMRIVPINLRLVIHLVVASLLPMAPLLLTVMPLKELLKLLLKLLT